MVEHPAGTHRAGSGVKADFSVFVPAYNEAENIGALFEALESTFTRHSLNGEVILVDDGSTDETWALANAAAERM